MNDLRVKYSGMQSAPLKFVLAGKSESHLKSMLAAGGLSRSERRIIEQRVKRMAKK